MHRFAEPEGEAVCLLTQHRINTMLTLVRPEESQLADEIEEQLKEMVVAHEVLANAATTLPYLLESGKVIKGKEDLNKFLLTLEKELNWSRSISADSCYLDPDGGMVC